MPKVPVCRTVTVHAFQGDRSTLAQRVRKALVDEMDGRGPGPSMLECLLYAGHTGVSTDADSTIHGFNPDAGTLPLSWVMQSLRNGDAFPGIVRDDTPVFVAAHEHGLEILTMNVILPEPSFRVFQKLLRAETKKSRYKYGFPNGDGDCNCTTWLERLTR